MSRTFLTRCGIAFAAWVPFFAIWFLFALSFANYPVREIFLASLISMGSAGLLGILVWRIPHYLPWPLGFRLKFYLLQLSFAMLYGLAWSLITIGFDRLIGGNSWSWTTLGRRTLMAMWFYAIFTGISYAVTIRGRLHEKETLATRAEALATAARLDALRARLNPHFLFNALHTLSALVKFRPHAAEGALERLGDMLRYTLKEDGRALVEFSEEYEFTQQYLSFEQLRYEDRLKVRVTIDPESYNFDIPPFSIQTLAENAVHHAISVRSEGGCIWITSKYEEDRLKVTVRDDGPGGVAGPSKSHQFGLRALHERLQAAYGSKADLEVHSYAQGFEAVLTIPASEDQTPSSSSNDKKQS